LQTQNAVSSPLSHCLSHPTHTHKMAVDLSEVDTHALVAEMERRLECGTKPEKRVILIGERDENKKA